MVTGESPLGISASRSRAIAPSQQSRGRSHVDILRAFLKWLVRFGRFKPWFIKAWRCPLFHFQCHSYWHRRRLEAPKATCEHSLCPFTWFLQPHFIKLLSSLPIVVTSSRDIHLWKSLVIVSRGLIDALYRFLQAILAGPANKGNLCCSDNTSGTQCNPGLGSGFKQLSAIHPIF